MAAVFLKLLNLSISASWLVLAVLVLRLVSKRSPKWVNVLLWGIVALRLVLPFSIESALSLIPSAETVSPAAVQFDPAPTITSGVIIAMVSCLMSSGARTVRTVTRVSMSAVKLARTC